MTNKLNIDMENTRRQFEPKLFPPVFKIIGGILIILALFSLIILQSIDLELLEIQKNLSSILVMSAIILGLLFFAWSKDKVEDEMTISIRLKAMSLSFIFGVLYAVIMPLIDLLFVLFLNEPIVVFSAQSLVISMIIFYLIIFYLQKLHR